ncbi:hypothetical protein MKL09_25155 [Methylobacterium sp. J-048]|uniref:hypothetical protein n=1 Tax=Methylobacterium sp. J-048 TaxID=2836635 RepID=UPI001FBB76BE|nr:hypothetical protein [Methylobacterium sp. J-048]MCJ2059805.1 hypothetical protein [Methylobacterium sp. J-048]
MKWPPPYLPPRFEDLDLVDDADRRDLVAAAYWTFDEATARALAVTLGVAFETCREAIERLGRRPS